MTALLTLALLTLTPDPLVPGQPSVLRGHTDAVTVLAFSPDGASLATGSRDKTVKVWSLKTGALQTSIPGGVSNITALAYSADSRFLAIGDAALKVRVIELATSKEQSFAHPDVVSSLFFSPTGTQLAVGGQSGNGVLYASFDGKSAHEFSARTLIPTADGKSLFASTRKGALQLIDAKTYKIAKESTGTTQTLRLVSSARQEVIAGFNGDGPDVWLFDAALKSLPVLKGKTNPDRLEAPEAPRVTSIALTPDGTRLLVARSNQTVALYEVKGHTLLQTWPLVGTAFLAVSADGHSFAAGDGADVKLWPLP